MEDRECRKWKIRKWEDLDMDVLVMIFQRFDIFELTCGVARVCRSWRHACRDPLLWKTLDLSMISSHFIKVPLKPYVYVVDESDKTLTRILKISLNLSRGSILILIFNYNLYVSDDQLTHTAERSRQLKRLVMPAWNRIKKTGMCKAISMWRNLESLTMPSIRDPPYLLEEISRSCNNFAELKIMGHFDIKFASALAQFLPNLKVLSLRCSVIYKDALLIILDGLMKLEVLNISHCLLFELPPPAPPKVVNVFDESICEMVTRLRTFLRCMSDECTMCQRTRNDEGLIKWFKYEEHLWKEDEVLTLAI